MQEIEEEWVKFPDPHSTKQALIMNFFLMHPECRDLVVACGTKFGKTMSGSTAILKALLSRPRASWRWLAPIYAQTQIGFDYCRRQLPMGDDIKPNMADMILNVKSLDAKLQFFHTTNPNSLEGFASAGAVFDEAAKIKKEAYTAQETTRTRTMGKHVYLSTPLGKNHFYHKYMEALEEMQLARRQMRMPRMMAIRAKTEDNPWIPKASIEHARRNMPERLFRQYYLAEFVDDADVFGNYREVFFGDKLYFDGDDQLWFHPEARESEVVIGVDWAKSVDFTVFVAFDVKTKTVVGFQRFHKRTYIEAIRALIKFSKKFKECHVVYHDKTGVGQAIDDQLAHTDLRYKGITFTNQWKTSNIGSLITSIEHRSIAMPYWVTLDTELGAYEVEVTDHGTMTYNSPSGQHDDTVMALVLAHAALMQYSDLRHEVRFIEDLVTDNLLDIPTSVEEYYRRILMDED